MRNLFDTTVLRQRLATRHGIHPAREPSDFLYAAQIVGLTPADLGYDRCSAILRRLRDEAAAQTNGDYVLSVIRDPRTHERQGYTVHTGQQKIADLIATIISGMIS